VDRRARISDLLRECVGRLHREARAVERGVQRDIACCYRARRRVLNDLAKLEILEKISRPAHLHAFALIASPSATVRAAISACMISTILPSREITPFPLFSGSAKASTIFLAAAISSSDGEKIWLHGSIWVGWTRVFPSKPRSRPSSHSRRNPSMSLMSL